ncbi:MAG TPA: DPP IV N-terminal domain-containing protein, partial [Pseudidiomarina sp.]|nr:DPP IV N-terminal domain-containing protein [Pseudidiomarina sp.]
MKVQALTLTGILLGLVTTPTAASETTRLLRQPDISANHITFMYGGDIWIADRNGSNPRPLTTSPAPESNPKFSPDGKWIAFTGNYDSNADVYMVPITGGQPARLTYHPSADVVNGWSPNGDHVLFASNREILNSRSNQLFEIDVDGGYPTKVMTAVAYEGQWSDDGKRLAYRPNNMAYSGSSGWRLHRGGSTPPIWIMNVEANELERVPHPNANEHNPFWLQDSVYFLSDRDNIAMNLYRYEDSQVVQLTNNTEWDIQSASGHGNHVIYEAGGYLYMLDVNSGASEVLTVELNAASEQRRPQWKDASRQLTSARLSTTGQRILITARGDVFTVPAKAGSTRNLTATSGVREFDALWSPDGSQVAYISDEGNQHSLVIDTQDGRGEPQIFLLDDSGYFNLLAWSPAGDRIIYHDNHLNLYSFELTEKSAKRIAMSPRRSDFQVSFTADGRYLAFTTSEANYFSQITIHDFSTGQQHRLTDGMSHAQNPVFADEYLYFAASVNTGPSQVGLDLSTQERPVRLGIYAAVLSADGKSPVFPKSGDEPTDSATDEKSETAEDTEKSVTIDFESIQNRIVGLPIAEKNYGKLGVGKDGGLFILESPQAGASNEPPGAGGPGDATLHRFNFEEQKLELVESGISTFELSPDRSKLLLITRPNQLKLGDASAKPDAKPVALADVRSFIDPVAEWQQIFDDTWRMQKEYFYDPNMHGIDWDAMYDKYQPMLAHVQRREDLNEVLVQLIAELQVGHNRVGGGDVYRGES